MAQFIPPPFKPALPLPDYLFSVARKYPRREIFLILQDLSSEEEATIVSVTWGQLLSDARRRADYIVQATGLAPRKLGDELLVVGLLAQNSYQYCVDLTAIIMLRWTLLFISTRNSSAAVRHLMLSAGGRCLLVEEGIGLIGGDVHDDSFATIHITKESLSSDVNRDGLSEWDNLLPSSEAATHDLYKEAQKVCMYMHTSGSTGHPKPIAWNHEFVLGMAMSMNHDRSSRAGEVIYTCLPLFHGGGFSSCYPNLLGTGGVYVFADTRGPVSSDSVMRHLRILQHRNIDVLLPPSILEDIVDLDPSHESLAVLRSLNAVIWGGAPLRQDVGDFLSQNGVRVVAWCGITEAGVLARSCYDPESDPADWSYLRLADGFNLFFEPMDEDTHSLKYSLIISPDYITPPVINHKNPVGFASSDVWMRHPDPKKSNLWKPVGRLDDVTVLSNGEKTDNKQLEGLLCSSPLISHAIVFGAGRFVNGTILTPVPPLLHHTDETVAAYLDNIWSHVEHVNHIIPRHSRLLRRLVLVAKPDKPFLFSDKGTVRSKASLALYDEEIDAAYLDMESGAYGVANLAPLPFGPSGADAVETFVGSLITDALGHAVGVDDDVFSAGLDSLLVTNVRSAANAALKGAGCIATLPKNVVYANPTITTFARYLQAFASASVNNTPVAIQGMEQTSIEQMIAFYTSHLPKHHAQSPYSLQEGDVYAVTGTTGSLGATFVSLLLQQPQVKKIYLMNRPSKAASMAQRHQDSFQSKGLDYTMLDVALRIGKVVYLEIDFSKKNLGLSVAMYDELALQLTRIVHIAWLINSKLVLSSFRTHVAGVRHLVDLALSSKHLSPPHLTFVSSIGVVGRWPGTQPVPEASLTTPGFCYSQGYAHAKYVSEKIIETAVAHCPGFRASIVRSGQISGALATGAWSRKEYMPSLIQASIYLKMVPMDLQAVHWLPVNVAAEILYSQIQHGASLNTSAPLTFYNLENARPTSWSLVVSALVMFNPDVPMKQVALQEWLEHVRMSPDNPAFKVLEFLEDCVSARLLPTLDTTKSRQAAGGLVDYEIDEGLVKTYVRFACADMTDK